MEKNKGTYNKEYYETHKKQCLQNIKNYQSTKLSAVTFRIKPTLLAKYKAAANKADMSFRAFVLEAIEEKIGKMP